MNTRYTTLFERYDDIGVRVELIAPASDVEPKALEVELLYPQCDGHVQSVEIGLEDARAADGIRVSYDFDRDGWSIQQASYPAPRDEENYDQDWQEVAFIQAWGRAKGEP